MAARTSTKRAPATLTKLDLLLDKVNKDMGAGTIIRGSEIHYERIPRITSGSLALDVALGGGWTVNTWHEIYGYESSGKTALILKTLAANMALDPNYQAFWAAAEDFVPDWAAQLGVDLKRLIVMNHNGMETVYGAVIEVLESREVDAVVIDSMPALVPESEDEAAMADMQVGLAARLNGKFFRKQSPAMRRSMTSEDRPVTGFIVNQFREKIGVMFGDPRTTPGGKGKNFYYFTRTELSRDEWITEVHVPEGQAKATKKDTVKVGLAIKALIKKNKSGPPEKLATFDFYFDMNEVKLPPGSYDAGKEAYAVGRQFGVLSAKPGGIYSYGDETWKGAPAVMEQLRWDVTLQQQIAAEVLQIVQQKSVGILTPVAEPEPVVKSTPAKRVAKLAPSPPSSKVFRKR
jgi:recombination protein RecA